MTCVTVFGLEHIVKMVLSESWSVPKEANSEDGDDSCLISLMIN